MRSTSLLLSAAAAAIPGVDAHSYIYGVFVNGIDQGSFKGIRLPAYNNAPPGGYANSPVKDLNSIDMRCNVLGDRQVPHTIVVEPGDNLTLDWHHDKRTDTDDVIADSHHGPALAYLSPDPPTDDSFVKIWHKGLYETSPVKFAPGKWATTSDIAKNTGKMNVRIPADLKAGYYLLRAELIGLHEGDASFEKNPIRGAQFYPYCVQLQITGNGTVELPAGVSFPGAYKYSDPGVVYDVYCSTKTKFLTPTVCTTTYEIPGPTVWEGAWPTTTSQSLGPIKGVTRESTWSSWVVRSVVTSATYVGSSRKVLGSATYTPNWSMVYSTPTAAP